ncbi:MAG TPA: outer membrane protein assembly factor BamA, partial [Candidatus Marinimicrobia bacterium]|nr:outer membrane protein assembly factor BamA [Candidatus Neomarinimicrobiota bacterium]
MINKLLFSLFIVMTISFAQSPQEIKLLSVEVDGNVLATDDMIRYTAGLRVGRKIKSGDFARSVKRLWNLGMFKNVQIILNDETSEGISITILVEENPIVGAIRYEGNKKIKDSKFEEEIKLITGQRIKPHLIEETIQKIKDLYSDEGFLLAKINGEIVETTVDNLKNKKAKDLTKDMVFYITENKKVKIGKIIFEGNHAFSDRHLRRVLKETKQQRWYLFWRSYFDKNKYSEDKESLVGFYRNKGYRDLVISSDSISYSKNKRRMNLHLHIFEGPRYKYGQFSLEGNVLYSDDELKRRLGLSVGDYFNEEAFNSAVYERMQGLYMDRGYIYSQIETQMTPVGEDSLDIHFVIIENKKVYVRNILISGNTKTRENVVRRELKIFPGDIFNRNKLIRSQREVWILNYFSNVIPDVIRVDEDEVDLDISVEEKSADRAQANIGFTGEYGITGGGGVEFNNFRGLGQRLNLSFNTGTNYSVYQTPSKYRSVSLSFTDPMVMDTPNLVGFSVFYTFRGAATNYSFPLDFSMFGGSLSWGRRFRWPDDFFRGHWVLRGVQKEYSSESTTSTDLGPYENLLGQISLGFNITQVIIRDSRDRPEFTTSGSRFSLETTISGGPLGGNEDFHKHVLNLEWFTPTFWKFVLMSSIKLGAIKPLQPSNEELSIVPFDEKFIMGGNGIPYGNMLRGYPDNSIGPLTTSGRPIGGSAMIKFTSEFRIPFSENPVVYGLVFGEMGNVWDTLDMTEPFGLTRTGPLSLKRSAGVGFRFFMPMLGMLGFDMGYGFDDITG